jgi:serine/threonine protein kinase
MNLVVSPNLPEDMRREEWSLEQFTYHKRLGGGRHFLAWHAFDAVSRSHVCIKVSRARRASELVVHQVNREVRIQASLSHPHIASLHAAWREPDGVLVMVQEYVPGPNMWKHLRACRLASDADVVNVAVAPLLSALAYLHERNIAHRDVKLENLAIDLRTHTVKLVDFGLAIDRRVERAVSRVGTIAYMAPEVYDALEKPDMQTPTERRPSYDETCDVWSAGIVVYELLTGYTLNHEFDEDHYPMLPDMSKVADSDARNFLRNAIRVLPHTRYSAAMLLHHDWVRKHVR